MKRVLFIYSPFSGDREILSCIDDVVEIHQKHNCFMTLFRYTKSDDIEDAMQLTTGQDYILIAGGDGTINRVVSVMRKYNIDIPIATIPAGTANDFAKMLGFSSSIKKACLQILTGEVATVDLGKANDHYFVNVLSAGLMTEVSQKTPTILKNTLGKLAYYVSSVQELPNFKKIHIKMFNDEFYFEDNALMVMVFNGKTAGNFQIAKQSVANDGILDVIVVRGDNLTESIKAGLHLLTGAHGKYPKGIVHYKAQSINIEFSTPVNFDVDGEIGPKAPLKVECIENGLKVIIPKVKKIEKSN